MSRISKSLNRDKIVYIAREGRKVVARADTIDALEVKLENRAAAMRIPLTVPEGEEVVDEEGEEDEEELEGTSGIVRSRKFKKKFG